MTGYVMSPSSVTDNNNRAKLLKKLENFPVKQKVILKGEVPDNILHPKPNADKTVYILVSGYICPFSKLFNELYWGEAINQKDVFISKLPWCGTHEDRACELYAQIKGTQTIYHHSNGKKGRDYTGIGLYPQWSSDNPIVLVGHSIGGCTLYSLQKLLVEMAQKQLLIENGSDVPFRMIRGIVTIASPLKGCLVPYPFGLEETDEDVVLRYGSIGYCLMVLIHFLQLYICPILDYIFKTDDFLLGLNYLYNDHPFILTDHYNGNDKIILNGYNVTCEMSLNRCLKTERIINELLLDNTDNEHTWYLSFCCRHDQFNKKFYTWSHIYNCVKRDYIEALRDELYWNYLVSKWLYSFVVGFKTFFMFGMGYLIQDDKYFYSLKKKHRRVNREFSPNTPAIDGEMHLNYQHYSHPRITVVEVIDTDHASIVPLPANKITQSKWFDNLYNLF